MALVDDIANFYPLRADVEDDASANNGTNIGVSFIVDGAITVADFNGSSDRFTAPNQANDPWSIENTTISLWVKTSGATGTDVIVGSFYTSGGATNPVYALYFLSSGVPALVIRSNLGTLVQANATTAIDDGLWHHIALTRSTTQIEIFVDGSSEATGGFSGGGTLNNNNVLGVGCWVSVPNTNVNQFYQGQMSDLAAWRRVLSPTEISAIQAAGVGQLAALLQVEAQGLFGSVVHSGPLTPVDASGLFGSVVHSGPLTPVDAAGLFASVVHEGTPAPPPPGGGGGAIQGKALQGDSLQGTSLEGNI